MRQVKLTDWHGKYVGDLQWDEKAGRLFGDATLIAKIEDMARLATKLGELEVAHSWYYPIRHPLKNALEFAVVLKELGFYADDLPLPQDDFDPVLRDLNTGEIVGVMVS